MRRPFRVCVAFLLAGCFTQTMHVNPAPVPLMFMPPPPDVLESGHSGFLLGSPVGITSSANPAITLKCAGFNEAVPGSDCSPPAGQPRFDLFVSQVFGASPAAPPILAMSLGIDVIVMHSLPEGGVVVDGVALSAAEAVLGETLPGAGGWMAFQFSVNSAEVGADLTADPPRVAHDILVAHSKGELDRTVFSYLVPGDTPTIYPEWESVSAMDPETLGLIAAEGEIPPKIHGLSMHMALYATDLSAHPGVFTTRPLPPAPTVYFTLRPEFLATSPLPGWLTVGNRNSGTIFRSHWRSSGWEDPEIYKTWQDLEIQGNEPPIIDGLSIDVDPAHQPGDEILFSLGPTTSAELQIQYTQITTPQGPPRRVVIKRRNNEYGSLGKELGAGAGIGDFCTKDPDTVTFGSSPIAVLDDYFVARRVCPGGLYTEPYPLSLPLPFDWWTVPLPLWSASSAGSSVPFPLLPRQVTPLTRHPVAIRPEFLVMHPHVPLVFPVSELALAVSGYRQRVDNLVKMRTCMSWPRPAASSGVATVRWGSMGDFSHPASIVWDLGESPPIPYEGRPLNADRPLKSATPVVSTKRAMVAQWRLVAGGRTYISAISALRY